MTVSYQLTAGDLRAFSAALGRFYPRGPGRLYWQGVLPALLVALALATSPGVAVVFTVAYACASWAVSGYQLRRWHAAVFSPDHLAVQTLPRSATLTGEGARFESAAACLAYRWEFVREVAPLGGYVCFTITPTERQFIPVAAFRDESHLRDFLDCARAYLKSQIA